MASLRSHLALSGTQLFRQRSFLPLALLPIVFLALAQFDYPLSSSSLDLAWEIGCFALGFAGMAIRAFVVGYAPAGTSGRTTRSPTADAMNTTGAYSVARHPLYLANLLMWLAIVLLTRHWWAVALVSLAFWLYYERIMYAEEEFLSRNFGAKFEDWAATTPAIWIFAPGWRQRWRLPPSAFSTTAVLLREPSSWFAFVAAFAVVEAMAEFFAANRLLLHSAWVSVFFSTAAVYALFQLPVIRSELQRRRTPALKVRLKALSRGTESALLVIACLSWPSGARLEAQEVSQRDLVAESPLAVSNAPRFAITPKTIALGVGLVVVMSEFDEPIANWSQKPALRGSKVLARGSALFRNFGDPGSLLIASGLYAAGRVTNNEAVSDAGLHAIEAIAVSGVTTGFLKLAVGRARPYLAQTGDPGEFGPEGAEFRLGRGSRGFTSFPSGHTTVAFATAAVLESELRERRPGAARFAAPLLYGAASLAGISRVYDNKHWASDVVMGAIVGVVSGKLVVRRQHGNRNNRLDRWFLPAPVLAPGGGAAISWAIRLP